MKELYFQDGEMIGILLAVCLITTFLTAFATAGTVHLVLRLQQRKAAQKGGDR